MQQKRNLDYNYKYMAVDGGPNEIVTNGLILALDTANVSSYFSGSSTWKDLNGNYTGTLTNSPGFSTDSLGSISFNGTNNFVNFLNQNFSVTGNNARSLFCWVKSSSAASKCIVSTGTANTGQSFNLVTYNSNKVGVMGYNLDFYPANGANIFDGKWHYIGAIADGSSTTTTYVDGAVDNTQGTLTYSTTGQNNYIGKSSHVGNENYWNGNIGIVHYYNRALSLSEIQKNYNALRLRYRV